MSIRASYMGLGFGALLWVGATACGESPMICTRELGHRVTPRDTTLSVGSSVTPTVELSSCGGRTHPQARTFLVSADPGVVEIHTAPLRMTAVAPGQAVVTVMDSTFGSLTLIRVTVAP